MRLPFFYGWVVVAVAFVTMALGVNARTAFSLLFPPILSLPPPLGDNLEMEVRGRKLPITTVMGRHTALGSVAGLCSVVLRGGFAASNLPVGIEFASRPGADRELLSLTAAVEALLAR